MVGKAGLRWPPIVVTKTPHPVAPRAFPCRAQAVSCHTLSEYVRSAQQAGLIATAGHPLVYAQKLVEPKLPTVLVYDHYVVQPDDPYELWQSPNFEPTMRGGYIYAHGTSEDKGQVHADIKALEALQATEALPLLVRWLLLCCGAPRLQQQ